jgi:valyl-tRNA synthetase
VRTHELFVPVGDLIDKDAEIEKLTTELEYTKGFLNSVMKKLGNERFVNNAPEAVVAAENKKKADAELKIKTLEQQIKNLK